MIIGDMHCDTLDRLYDTGEDIFSSGGNVNFNDLNDKYTYFQIFACYIDKRKYPRAKERVMNLINTFYLQTLKYPQCFAVVKKNKIEAGKMNSMLAVEGADCLEGREENLDILYKNGVRLMTLVWNNVNELGTPAVVNDTDHLTEFGKKIIKKMNLLKMAVDVSHLNTAGFWDAAETSDFPIVASHSNSRKICDNVRNLTDEQFKFISAAGGVVGINTYPYFLNNSDMSDSDDVIKHIEHFLSIGGENAVALGFDYDGTDVLCKGFENMRSYEFLMNEMGKRNFSEELIAKIMGKNLIRYIKRLLK